MRSFLNITILLLSGTAWLDARQPPGTPGSAGTNHTKTVQPKEGVRLNHAHGTFDVKLTPRKPEDGDAEAGIASTRIEKTFQGDLVATSRAEMLSAANEGAGSGAYVAIERVTGSLNGRSGSFLLMHNGTMTRTAQKLNIGVVPDSGTGALAGLSGSLEIKIVEGIHQYHFKYTLGQSP